MFSGQIAWIVSIERISSKLNSRYRQFKTSYLCIRLIWSKSMACRQYRKWIKLRTSILSFETSKIYGQIMETWSVTTIQEQDQPILTLHAKELEAWKALSSINLRRSRGSTINIFGISIRWGWYNYCFNSQILKPSWFLLALRKNRNNIALSKTCQYSFLPGKFQIFRHRGIF